MFDVMRRNTKLIMWITAASFVLLIFLAWGMEFQGIGNNNTGRAAGVIGRINGKPITAQAYTNMIMMLRDNYAQQGQPIDEALEVQLRDQAWNQIVQEYLMLGEIERLKLSVTDREIAEAIRNSPLPQMMQLPQFQTNGQFDYSKYLSALNDPNQDWLPLENMYRADLPKQKLQQLVVSSVKISEADVRRQFETENTKAKVAFAFLPASKYPVDVNTLDESAIRAYYDQTKDDYRTDQQAFVEYVRIEKKAVEADTIAARDLIAQAAQEARAGEDFSILVSAYSEAPAQMRGGDQGTYMTREQFSSPVVRDAAFALAVGQVSEILAEPAGFHLIKVEDRRTTPDKDEVKIADIFVPVTLSGETLTSYSDRAQAIAGAARESGGDLRAAAQAEEIEVSAAGPFGRRSFVQRLGQLVGFMDWAFNADPNTIVTWESPDSWYVIKMVRRREAGLQPYEEVKEKVKSDYALSLSCDQAAQAAERILQAAKSGTSLLDAAKSEPNASADVTDEFAKRGFPRGLGNDPAVMARAFADPPGLVPQVIKTKRGAYVIDILARNQAEETQYAAQRQQIRQQLFQRKRTDIVNRWMEDLRSRAKIEDYRGEQG